MRLGARVFGLSVGSLFCASVVVHSAQATIISTSDQLGVRASAFAIVGLGVDDESNFSDAPDGEALAEAMVFGGSSAARAGFGELGVSAAAAADPSNPSVSDGAGSSAGFLDEVTVTAGGATGAANLFFNFALDGFLESSQEFAFADINVTVTTSTNSRMTSNLSSIDAGIGEKSVFFSQTTDPGTGAIATSQLINSISLPFDSSPGDIVSIDDNLLFIIPVILGEAFELDVELSAFASVGSQVSFANTLLLTDVTVQQGGSMLDDAQVNGATAGSFVAIAANNAGGPGPVPAPLPATLWLLLGGLASVAATKRARRA